MRKFFFLITIFAFAITANATIFEIDPGYNPDWTSASENIQHTISTNITAAGDTIVLRDGIYVENYSINITNPVVIMADKGARPIVQAASYFSVRANTKVIGVTFIGTGEYAFHVYNSTPKSLVFEDCEFSGYSKFVITGSSTSADLDSCVINNCYFHDTGRGAVQFESSSSREDGQNSCEYLKVTNTTITNISALSGSVIDLRNKGNVVDGADSLLVDHVTIYNWAGGSNGAIMGYKTKHIGIYNTIIAQPSSGSYDVYCYGGYVKNILTNNTTHKDWNPLPTFVNDMTGDPLFVDAANGNYALSATSPAIGAAIDGSNLGDPRWNAPSKYASTDFSTPYAFTGDKAGVGGNVWRHEDGYLYYSDKSVCGTAIWGIHATRACAVEAQLNMNAATTTGHKFKVVLIDAKGNRLDSVAEKSQTSDGGNINLKGLMYMPKAGDYFIKLYNLTGYSSSKINGVTLSYAGGAAQEMPGTTDLNEAWFSNNGTRADGAISYTSIGDGCWAKWNITVTDTAWYAVTANIKGKYGHSISVDFYKEGSATPVATAAENGTVYDNNQTSYPAALGMVYLPKGNYEMKFSNSIGDAALISIKLEYAGGNVTNIAADANTTLNVADAWFTSSCVREDGKIEYHTDNANAWIKWNIAATATKYYDVTVNIEAPNGHEFAVNIYENENEEPIATIAEDFSNETGTLALELGRINLVENKNYVVKVTNTPSGSKAKVLNVVFVPVAATATSLPGTLEFNDAVLSPKAHITNSMLYFNEIGDTNPQGEWAQWAVTTNHDGAFLFTMNVESANGQSYRITILDGENHTIASNEQDLGTGTKTMKHFFELTAGNYFVKVENTKSYSKGHLTSLVVTEPDILLIDENATVNTVIVDNYRNGNHHIKVSRTIIPDMYNTICLPFDVEEKQLKSIFGEDVELMQMNGATFTNGVLSLNFANASSIYRGTPYIIKTSAEVANPIFIDVEIKVKVAQASTGDDANFVGTFIKDEIPASEYNLFLGPNDTLYFPLAATPIKGYRAWFRVNVPGGANSISAMRIVKGTQVVTDIDLVGTDSNTVKIIENGQLVIIRDGVRYNVMGTKIQ